MEKREQWLDYLRAFACILVSFGHMFMSFQEAAIIKDSTLVSCFVQIIYHFHVYIFFFCSGYLFQRSFSKYDIKTIFWKKIERCVDFIIIYVLFSGITYFIKTILSGDVNSPIEHTFLNVLLKHPINQMWYMYAIIIIMFCTPVIKTDRTCIAALLVVLCMKIAICIPRFAEMIYVPLNYLFMNQIWFLLGGIWQYKNITLKKWVSIVLTGFFLVMSIVEYVYGISNSFLDAILTLTGVLASAELFRWATKGVKKMSLIWKIISKYMLQIYLLHTICAAGIRIILLKSGITNTLIHIMMGVLFSFVVPILCAAFIEHTKVLNVIFYPTKTIRELRK